jgi:hypothetical protein
LQQTARSLPAGKRHRRDAFVSDAGMIEPWFMPPGPTGGSDTAASLISLGPPSVTSTRSSRLASVTQLRPLPSGTQLVSFRAGLHFATRSSPLEFCARPKRHKYGKGENHQ